MLSYKRLAQVERAFRSMKTLDLHVRPIHHRLEERVRAHIFLCMLAYYVQWHMMNAWRELLFTDEDQQARASRDPVAPAPRSAGARRKAQTRTRSDGGTVHSFRTLLHRLGTIVRNHCRVPGSAVDTPTMAITTLPSATQQRAYELLDTIET